jgi:carbon storage regulator CsrA
MLVLTRRIEEEVIIGDDIRVTVLSIQGNTVRLGFTAPRSVRVMRLELQGRQGPAADNGTARPGAGPETNEEARG